MPPSDTISIATQLQITTLPEQRFVLPGWYDWEQFEKLDSIAEEIPGLRISYLDGQIELMTLSEEHEIYSQTIAMLLIAYFVYHQIEFLPVGSATRRSKQKSVSFEPDESYYIGERKEHPDLAVEVVVTSGSAKKLEKYKRLKIQEVWFWQDNSLSIYHLTEGEYELGDRSQILPDLDVATFIRCLKMPSKLAAITAFQESLKR